jgi:excisionase family DNA binding protein
MTRPPVEERYAISVKEAAILLSLGKSTVYAMIEQNRFPYIRISKTRVIVPMAGLREWMQKNMAGIKGIEAVEDTNPYILNAAELERAFESRKAGVH